MYAEFGDVTHELFFNQANGNHDVHATTDGASTIFETLVRDAAKGAFVVITESRCWVAALTNVKPGDYFNADGSRSACAWNSVQAGCAWKRDGRQT